MRRGGCLALAALLVAGCGGGGDARLSKNGYEAKLRSTFAAANAELGSGPHTAGSIRLLTRIATSYEEVARRLDGLRTPQDVQALNGRLVAAASARADSLDALIAELDGASGAKRQRVLAEYGASQVGQDGFDRAVAALEARGYRFRPNAGT